MKLGNWVKNRFLIGDTKLFGDNFLPKINASVSTFLAIQKLLKPEMFDYNLSLFLRQHLSQIKTPCRYIRAFRSLSVHVNRGVYKWICWSCSCSGVFSSRVMTYICKPTNNFEELRFLNPAHFFNPRRSCRRASIVDDQSSENWRKPKQLFCVFSIFLTYRVSQKKCIFSNAYNFFVRYGIKMFSTTF